MGLATAQSNAVADHRVSDELMVELHEHFDEAQIIELGMVIAVLVGMARLLFSFDLVDEERGCPIG